MNKSLTISLISAFTLGLASATPAEDDSIWKEWSMSATSHLCTGYVFNGFLLSDKPVLQSDITISNTLGFSFSVWWSTDFESEKTWGDEVDYILTYEKSFGEYATSFSVSYFDCFNLLNKEGDAVEIKGMVSRDFELSKDQTVTPFAKLCGYFPVEAESGSNGLVVEVGTRYCFQLTDKVNLKQQLSVIHDSGAYSSDSGFIAKYLAGAELKINDRVKFDVGLEYNAMLSSFSNDSRGEGGNQIVGFVGLGFTW